MTHRESFIVRLNLEPAGGDTAWIVHGEVEHIRTRQVWRFASLGALADIFDRYVRSPSDEAGRPDSR